MSGEDGWDDWWEAWRPDPLTQEEEERRAAFEAECAAKHAAYLATREERIAREREQERLRKETEKLRAADAAEAMRRRQAEAQLERIEQQKAKDREEQTAAFARYRELERARQAFFRSFCAWRGRPLTREQQQLQACVLGGYADCYYRVSPPWRPPPLNSDYPGVNAYSNDTDD